MILLYLHHPCRFSGDTRPCDLLVKEAGANSLDPVGPLILIHEATFETGLDSEARDKNHSTVQEAIDVGMGMKAENLILTHFSQRYPKIPVLENKEGGSDRPLMAVSLAFDMMSVRIPSELKLLPDLIPAFQLLFAEEEKREENEDDNPEIKKSEKLSKKYEESTQPIKKRKNSTSTIERSLSVEINIADGKQEV
jgi:ribonuclease Z